MTEWKLPIVFLYVGFFIIQLVIKLQLILPSDVNMIP